MADPLPIPVSGRKYFKKQLQRPMTGKARWRQVGLTYSEPL